MLNFKIRMLGLKKISEMDGTPSGEYASKYFSKSLNMYDYYTMCDNNPEQLMFYSTSYLEHTPVLTLLWRHHKTQRIFR